MVSTSNADQIRQTSKLGDADLVLHIGRQIGQSHACIAGDNLFGVTQRIDQCTNGALLGQFELVICIGGNVTQRHGGELADQRVRRVHQLVDGGYGTDVHHHLLDLSMSSQTIEHTAREALARLKFTVQGLRDRGKTANLGDHELVLGVHRKVTQGYQRITTTVLLDRISQLENRAHFGGSKDPNVVLCVGREGGVALGHVLLDLGMGDHAQVHQTSQSTVLHQRDLVLTVLRHIRHQRSTLPQKVHVLLDRLHRQINRHYAAFHHDGSLDTSVDRHVTQRAHAQNAQLQVFVFCKLNRSGEAPFLGH